MVKGYQTLVDEGTSVSYRDAMDAALKLNEIARKDEGAIDRARILADMGRIIDVVRTFIPCRTVARRAGGPTRRNPCSHRHRSRLKGCAWWRSTTPRTRTTLMATGHEIF